MGVITIKKGLQLPISGDPEQNLEKSRPVTRVALVGDDYVGMKPTMEVQVGDEVKLGQVLFSDKKIPGVKYTSPGTGRVVEINRGARRHFESIVVELAGEEEITFESFAPEKLETLDREKVQTQLIESGLWPSFRTRPFSRAPVPGSAPHSIFITAMDTNPLAPDMEKILAGREEAFKNGLTVLARLTEGSLYLCKAEGSTISSDGMKQVVEQEFAGPHPAGNAGTHIHFLDPVGEHKTVWHIGLQDVIAIGRLFTTGKLDTERIIAVAGPSVQKPRLIKTRLGACLDEVMADELAEGDNRVISGSVLSGRRASESYAYLGKFHQQVSALREGRERTLLGWFTPRGNLHSVKNILLPRKGKIPLTTARNGGLRSMVPVGSYEKVMPLDILPTYLLRALAVKDIEDAEALGCLELDEEDLALCSYVCPAKMDHCGNLRTLLTLIEKEG